MQKSDATPPLWKIWWTAARPHTLTASVAPVIVGYCAGISLIRDIDPSIYTQCALKWAAFCMLMQLGTNLHNDYADFVKGADTDKRVGQARATQRGWLTPAQTAAAATLVLSFGLVLGVAFVSMIDKNHESALMRTYFMTFIVISSIFNAFAYTGGPWPLGFIGLSHFSIGYSGLGDVFVFLYFGLVATLMLPFLYLASVSASDSEMASTMMQCAPYAVQVACLATNIIVVNNLRDRHTDVSANKRTLAVRFGANFSRVEFVGNIAIAYGLVLIDWLNHSYSLLRLIPLLSVPIARNEIGSVLVKEGRSLNPHVGGSAKVQLLFCILLGLTFWFS